MTQRPTQPDTADIGQGPAEDGPQRVGWFRFYFAQQSRQRSEQAQRRHGYRPGTVTPTTELILSDLAQQCLTPARAI